ncbi:MAG: DUF2177 family protein [Tissierellia bacterium]|nr:DUF2177 family protein [Tissierellia bacterium]
MYIITLIIFFAIDIIWLGFIAKDIYKEHLGFIMGEKTNWIAAIVFYMVYIIGLIFFALNPALQKDSLIYAALVGGFFGLITYATYDMTNLATLKDWSIFITAIDITWGTLLCSATSSISFIILRAMGV